MLSYFLLAFVAYLSFVTIFRRRNKAVRERPRNNKLSNVESSRDVLRVHDGASEDILCEITGNGDQISSLVFLPDGRRLASACKNDCIIRIWSTDHGREVGPPIDLGVAVSSIAVSGDGKWVISGGIDGKVAIWNTTSRQQDGRSSESHELKVTALDVSPDSLRVVSGSDDGIVMVWRIDSQPALHLDLSPMRHQDSSPVSSVKFSPAGGRIALSYICSGHYAICIWHSWTGHQLTSIPTDGQPMRSLAWASDGHQLFVGGPHGSIRCFDVRTQRRLVKSENFQSDVITSLYVSNSGQFLISASASSRAVDIWDIRDISSFKRLHSYRRSEVLSMAISPNELELIHGGKDKKIYGRDLSKVLKTSSFYHHLTFLKSSSEPFMCISHAALESWTDKKLDETEEILSDEITDERRQDLAHYARANRSLVRTRLRKWDEALEDVKTVLHNGRNLPIVYIANGIALCEQGRREEAECTLDTALRDNDGDTKSLVERVKFIILSEAEHLDALRREIEPPSLFQDIDICPLTKAQRLVRFAELRLKKGDYDMALQLLSRAPDLDQFLDVPEAKAISLIFGWNVHDLQSMIYYLTFQALAASGCIKEAIRSLYANEINMDEDVETRKAVLGLLCEKLGDKLMCFSNYDDAIACYTKALALFPDSRMLRHIPDLAGSLAMFDVTNSALESRSKKHEEIALYMELLSSHPQKIICLLLKRSKAEAEAGFWKEALNDANEVIRLDPLCPWGYERRRAATPIKQSLGNQIEGLSGVLLTIERQIDQDISQLRQNPISSEVVIDAAIRRTANFCPLVLIDVKTGFLCDEAKRKHIFKEDKIYGELLSSTASHLDIKHIVQVVARFFRYVMFSHTWEGQEPTFQYISQTPEKSVYALDLSFRLNKKLHQFCEAVKNDCEGYRWSWSDTCCIDKNIEAVYKKSIRSMYNWYKWSALTLVLLADDSALKDNRWMTRAWTLQELLSPKTMRFYDRNWKPYRGDTSTNHKNSSHILRELAEAIYVAPDDLADFSPETLSVREKLRLASTRNATMEEDIAYSLIGIFNSNLIPEPRDAAIALGLLLQEIADRYQETAAFDWTGEPSRFNSCLPARISVYSQPPYIVRSVAGDYMEKRVTELRGSSALGREASKLYGQLSQLDPLLFTNQRLYLPCITFQVAVTECSATSQRQACGRRIVYLAKGSALGEVEFTSTKTLSSQNSFVLVYPWIRDLLTQAHLPGGDCDAQALRLLVLLEQPFRALLLAKHTVLKEYQRVATDDEIRVPGRKFMSLKDIHAERLVIL